MFRGRLQLEGTLDELRSVTGRESLTDMFLDLMAREQQIDRDSSSLLTPETSAGKR
jgi:hypothetical protein